MVEKQLQSNMLSGLFLRKVSIVSGDLIIIGGLFQIVGAATVKARLPTFSFVLGTKSCLETDELRVLEISEKSSKLTKYVDC